MNTRRIFHILIGVVLIGSVCLQISPVHAQQACPSGTGPGGITAGGYSPQSLTQEQRQWLFEAFGHTGIAPDGYGGESCGQPQPPSHPAWFGQGCSTNYTGPGNLKAGGYPPANLSQDQRQWLFEVFGNEGIASDGYGGNGCDWQNEPPPRPAWFGQGCSTNYTGPGNLRAGGYPPADLSQKQRQWLFEVFGNNGYASEGYGGNTCDWQNKQPENHPKWFGQGCSTSYTGPDNLKAGGYSPQDLTQKQRQWLFEVFGNNGYASEGYGGETCPGQNNQPTAPTTNSDCSSALSPNVSVGQNARSTYVDGQKLRIRSGPSKQYDIVGSLVEGAKFTIIGGPVCGDSLRFWNIRTNSLSGWVADSGDGYYWIEPYNNPEPTEVLIPTQEPEAPQSQSSDTGYTSSCDLGYDAGKSLVGKVYADVDTTQCTYHVYDKRPDLQKCWGTYTNAKDWDNWVRDPNISGNCNLSVTNSSDIRVGDVVVWEKDCAYARDNGHVALVTGIDRSKQIIYIDEANWDMPRTFATIDSSCMSFIHAENLPQNQQNQPSDSSGQLNGKPTSLWDSIVNWWNSLFGK